MILNTNRINTARRVIPSQSGWIYRVSRWLAIDALLLFLLFGFNLNASAQKGRKTNWLQEKNDYTGRWRVGAGLNAGEPTGVHLQFYRLSRICTQDFSITKKMAITATVSKEGYIFASLIEKHNNSWSQGGTRFGIDIKFYIPFHFNPYLSFGSEVGTRVINNVSDFYPDVVGRIGIELKIFGVKLSSRSSLSSKLFIEGKYNQCLTNEFSYFLPSAGLRFHFL